MCRQLKAEFAPITSHNLHGGLPCGLPTRALPLDITGAFRTKPMPSQNPHFLIPNCVPGISGLAPWHQMPRCTRTHKSIFDRPLLNRSFLWSIRIVAFVRWPLDKLALQGAIDYIDPLQLQADSRHLFVASRDALRPKLHFRRFVVDLSYSMLYNKLHNKA